MLRLVPIATLFALAVGAKVPIRTPGRIVGGTDIDISEQPHQVALESRSYQICGGSVISEKAVVTAAHCTSGSSASSLQIRAGTSYVQSGGEVRQVATIYQHPDYSSGPTDYDVSVLILAEPLTFSDKIKPIAIANVLPAPGTVAITSGWGALNEGGWGSDVLQAVNVPIVSQQECKKAYGESSITDRMICAGFPEGGKDACQGDSGGPLVANNQLVGIVSWGAGCARPNYPGVYSSVANLHQFIVDSAGKA